MSVPDVFAAIAVSAGHTSPDNWNAAANGQRLQWHLDYNTAPITSGIPAGETWDFVVLQDYSTWPTHIGNLTEHLSSSLGLYQAVAAHSPAVEVVMYETWARGYGHTYYSNGSFPGGPTQMQQELRDGYQASMQNINATAGSSVAKVASAGDAWELADFPSGFYGDGNYHASNKGTLLNSLVLYGTVYEDPTTSDIDLTSLLGSLGLSVSDGQYLTSLADSVLAVPEPTSIVVSGVGLFLLAVRRNRATSARQRGVGLEPSRNPLQGPSTDRNEEGAPIPSRGLASPSSAVLQPHRPRMIDLAPESLEGLSRHCTKRVSCSVVRRPVRFSAKRRPAPPAAHVTFYGTRRLTKAILLEYFRMKALSDAGHLPAPPEGRLPPYGAPNGSIDRGRR